MGADGLGLDEIRTGRSARFTIPKSSTMTTHPFRRLSAAAALLAAALLASCESPTGGGAGAPARMDVVAGDLQTATAGAELPQALVVRVLDDRGHPVRGQIVNFVVTAGGGTVFAGSAATNQQ